MKWAMLTLLLLSLSLVACGDAGGGDPAVDTEKAVKAATIADAIAANPAGMDAILEKHGMTLEEFEALILEVTEDPELSDVYVGARKVATPE